MNLTDKQKECYHYLYRPGNPRFILFGGAAGGGKSRAGAYWIVVSALSFDRSRWLVARSELKQLRLTTLKTIFEILRELKVPPSRYNYNQQMNVITFFNGAEIIFSELKFMPSDPEYTTLGSLELTGAFIDEAGEMEFSAFDVLKSRVGRCMNKEYGITPKILLTCNPIKNWLYNVFYLPDASDTLPKEYMFIRSLYSDNKFLGHEYIESLNSISDPVRKARLMSGDWEYDSSANELFIYDRIISLLSNEFISHGEYYITIDAARMGSDKAVLILWSGFRAIEIFTLNKSRTTDIAAKGRQWANIHHIPMTNVICDEDGVGGGVVDILRCRGFVNNATPMQCDGETENYSNMKAQCYYRFAKRVNENAVYIQDIKYHDEIIQELDATRRDKMEAEGKLSMLMKEQVKRAIGRSPDFADALMMREYFELRTKPMQRISVIGENRKLHKCACLYKLVVPLFTPCV